MNAVREAAWKTRRARYGERGHAGSYKRPTEPVGRRALALVIRLHEEGTLSEGQCCKALDLDRLEFRTLCDARPSGGGSRADQLGTSEAKSCGITSPLPVPLERKT